MRMPERSDIIKLMRKTYGMSFNDASTLLDGFAKDQNALTKREKFITAALAVPNHVGPTKEIARRAIEVADYALSMSREYPNPITQTEDYFVCPSNTKERRCFALDSLSEEALISFPYSVWTKNSPSILGGLVAIAATEIDAKNIAKALNRGDI